MDGPAFEYESGASYWYVHGRHRNDLALPSHLEAMRIAAIEEDWSIVTREIEEGVRNVPVCDVPAMKVRKP